MRGFLVLVLGAVLIWVGVRAGAEPDEAQAKTDNNDEVIEPVVLDDEGTDTDVSEPPTVSGGEQESHVSEPPEQVTPVTPQPEVEDEPNFALGPPGPDPTELGRLLLESWLLQSPVELEKRLNGDDAIPAGQRRLLAAFWQAMVGQPGEAQKAAKDLEGDAHVTSAEHSLLVAAGMTGDEPRPVPAASSRRDPIALAMRMVMLEDRAESAQNAGDWALSATSYSDLLQLEMGAPWEPHREALRGWAAQLGRAQASHRLHPEGAWAGATLTVDHGDGLTVLRKRAIDENPGILLCVGLLREVNDLGKHVHPGQELRVPLEVPNVLVDLDSRMLVYRHGTEAVLAWEVGIGKPGHDTPTGSFRTGDKLEDPPWMPLGGEPLPFGHPENPLGTRWIAWQRDGVNTSYGFHGTWQPEGVGDCVSQGCIRMRNEDVEVLFELLPMGAEILVQP